LRSGGRCASRPKPFGTPGRHRRHDCPATPMDRIEALRVLGLPSTARPAEIKEAYRDLAKVWHPDRFGTDPRLRAKAEETLKGNNEAYQALETGSAGRGGAAARPPRPDPPPRPKPRPAPPPPPPPRPEPPPPTPPAEPLATAPTPLPGFVRRVSKAVPPWAYVPAGFILLVSVNSFWGEPGPTARPERAASQPAVSRVDASPPAPTVSESPTAEIREEQPAAASPLPRGTSDSSTPDLQGEQPTAAPPLPRPASGTSSSNEPTPDVTVTPPAKPSAVASQTPSAYPPAGLGIEASSRSALPTQPAGRREYSEPSESERSSIESVCYSAKIRQGPAASNRCLIEQLRLMRRLP